MKTAHEVDPQIPENLSQTIERAMALEPTQRFQTAQEFKAAMQRKAKPVAATPAPSRVDATVVAGPALEYQVAPVIRAPAAPSPSMPMPRTEAPQTGRFALGMGMGVVVVLVLCVLAAGAIGYWAINSQSSSATETANAEVQATTDERVRLTNTAQVESQLGLTATAQL